jgi:hypothetical protein
VVCACCVHVCASVCMYCRSNSTPLVSIELQCTVTSSNGSFIIFLFFSFTVGFVERL